ncbi:MAG: hypothetical protein II905_04675, partial [Muribaculaceae bacterium]|nr:hypothetical protein [Muribaculaceae bacterium]
MKGSSIGMHCSAYGDTVNCALKLVNCVLTNSASTCLATATCYVQAIGTEISDAAEEVAYFAGGKVVASQCTFANNYLFKVPSLPIVNIFDVEYSDGTIGKIKAYFDNSIIYGLAPELNEGKLDEFNVFMRYCLFKSNGNDDAHFINCIWEGDPMFLTVRDDHFFDYRLDNESDAIGKGNPALCPAEARYDRYGYDRLAGGAVDLGAYVWVPVEEEE